MEWTILIFRNYSGPPSLVTEEPRFLIPRLAKCAQRGNLLGGS